jgi:hypothetical protein
MQKTFLVMALILIGLGSSAFAVDRMAGSEDTGFASGVGGADLFSAAEVKCMLNKIGIKDPTAQKTAEDLTEAAKVMKLPPQKFNRTSFMHLLAQIKAESDGGSVMTEKAPKSADKTGYGYIQVTGAANLRDAEKCINEVAPGKGNGIASNPEGTLGKSAPDKFLAALASFCWWKKNMVDNDKHNQLTLTATAEADHHVSEVVNTGHIGGQMTGGFQNAVNRGNTFTQLQDGERSCRQISI